MNKPVAWMIRRDENITKGIGHEIQLTIMDANSPEFWSKGKVAKGYTVYPLYTNPHPDNLGLAESIIKQQQLKIDNLLENNARLDAEIEVLKSHPANACKHGVDDGACKECYLESSNPYKAITNTKIEPTVVSYTHPVKELTDEEILEIYHDVYVKHHNDGIDFAKAILRKAQEK